MLLGRSCGPVACSISSQGSITNHSIGLLPLRPRLVGIGPCQHSTAAKPHSSSPYLLSVRLSRRINHCIRAISPSSQHSSGGPSPDHQQHPKQQQLQQRPLWDQQQELQQHQQRPGLLQHVYRVLGSLALLVCAAGISARPSYAAGLRWVPCKSYRNVHHHLTAKPTAFGDHVYIKSAFWLHRMVQIIAASLMQTRFNIMEPRQLLLLQTCSLNLLPSAATICTPSCHVT